MHWIREGADWVLKFNRRKLGRVFPDDRYPGIWRSRRADGQLSDMANLSTPCSPRQSVTFYLPQSVHFHLQNSSKNAHFLRPNRRTSRQSTRGLMKSTALGRVLINRGQ